MFQILAIFLSSLFLVSSQSIVLLNKPPQETLFDYSQLYEIKYDNTQQTDLLEFIININSQDGNDKFNDWGFLLLASYNQLDPKQFQPDIVKLKGYKSKFSVYFTENNLISIDSEGLASAKKTLVLDIASEAGNQNKNIYFYIYGPYEFGKGAPLKNENNYKLFKASFQLKDSMSCLKDCNRYNLQGVCVNQDKYDTYCLCEQGFIDRDCGIKARQLVIGDDKAIIQVPAGEKTYFYFDIDDDHYEENQTLILEMKFSTDTEGFLISILQNIQKNNFLPDYYLWVSFRINAILGQFLTGDNSRFKYVMVPESQGKRLVFLVSAYESTQLEFEVYVFQIGSLDTSMIILYIILGVLGFIVLLYILYIARRSKRLRQQNQQLAQNLALHQANAQARGRQIQIQQKLTVDQINEFMPSKKYDSHMKQVYNSDQCAVCLEEFVVEKDQVRVTICQHLFHCECLGEWLKKQQNCPFCRQELSIDKLKEYQSNPVAYQSIQGIKVKQSLVVPMGNQFPSANQNEPDNNLNQVQANSQRNIPAAAAPHL